MTAEYWSGTAQHSGLETMLAERMQIPATWEEPFIFDLSRPYDRRELEAQMNAGNVTSVYDGVNSIASELYEIAHPDKKTEDALRHEFVADIKAQGVTFGRWVLMPWSGNLVRYAEVADHRALRTSRNRDLVTAAEQRKLYDTTIAVFGLSVGSNVLEKLVISGIGGKIVMGDGDRIETSNLNRINGSQLEVGTRKVHLAARKISEIDPYIKQVHFKQGITPANLGDLRMHQPDILFDEVDSIEAKVTLRQFAQEERIPLIMASDVGDTSLIDVERYDLDPSTQPFNGKLSQEEIIGLQNGSLTPEEARGMAVKIVGMENITPRVMNSVTQVGKTLPGLAQLGITASAGASYATFAAREILLGHDLPSGRYVVNPHEVFGVSPE